MRRARRRGNDAQAVLETALVIPIMLFLVCNFVALMIQVTVQERLDSATALAAASRFQAPNNAFDGAGVRCCPDPRCCGVPSSSGSLLTAGLPTGCRYAAETFYGSMQRSDQLLTWHAAPLCLSGGQSAGASSGASAPVPYPASPRDAHVSCVVGSVDASGVLHPGFLDRSLNPPAGLYVVTCDATATLDFSRTPLAWGVFWSPTLHANAEALPPPFRQ